MYTSIPVFAFFVIHILYAHVVLYLRDPWKIGESQMGHPRKIKHLLTYLLIYLLLGPLDSDGIVWTFSQNCFACVFWVKIATWTRHERDTKQVKRSVNSQKCDSNALANVTRRLIG